MKIFYLGLVIGVFAFVALLLGAVMMLDYLGLILSPKGSSIVENTTGLPLAPIAWLKGAIALAVTAAILLLVGSRKARTRDCRHEQSH